MKPGKLRGELFMENDSIYPNTIYRVSVKALIKDDNGHILVVKENQEVWDLPGGGLDHGERADDGIKRELSEELGVGNIRIINLVCVKTIYIEHKQSWLMWIVYEVELNSIDFHLGDEVVEVTFIDPKLLAVSNDIYEKMAFEVVAETIK